MTKTMTNEQFSAYMEANGYGISSENGNVAYVSDVKGNVVAMYWRGEKNYLETLDEPITEMVQSPVDAVDEALTSGLLAAAALALCYIAIVIFA